jgi:glycine cleavage system aminomethyltransferase T
MAYVDQNLTKVGTKLLAEQRGKMIEVSVAKMPFIPAKYYKEKKW